MRDLSLDQFERRKGEPAPLTLEIVPIEAPAARAVREPVIGRVPELAVSAVAIV